MVIQSVFPPMSCCSGFFCLRNFSPYLFHLFLSSRQVALCWFIVFSLSGKAVIAQFSDSFSDRDFSADPTWSGNTTSFIVDSSSLQLRLNAPVNTNYAYLSTPSKAINSTSWTFTLTLNFNPSGNNFARVYLVSDRANISADLSGYFVAIGEENDAISLYRQSGSSVLKIIGGKEDRVNLFPILITIRVTRDEIGTWTLFSDVGNTGVFSKEGTQLDDTFFQTAYFGIACYYTPSRANKFFFDDFVTTGNPYIDITPPTITFINVLSDKKIAVVFDEPVDKQELQDLTTYTLSRDLQHPINALLSSRADTVILTFQTPFKNGVEYTLTIVNVSDLTGNKALQLTHPFRSLKPVPAAYKDVIFSEILAIPTPRVQLPNVEFVELYNRSKKPFLLTGWTLSDERTSAKLPEKLLLPGTYRIVSSLSGIASFSPSLSPIGVISFPLLNNDEDRLVLKTPEGLTIDSVHYTSKWYRNTEKAQGGWSLELIDPNDICREQENWQASENERGGTPGLVNSVLASKPDLQGPKLLSVSALSATQLLLIFDESLENPLRSASSFSFTPSLIVTSSSFEDASLRSLILQLDSPIQPRQSYTLLLKEIYDCSGNVIQPDFNQLAFALPEQAHPKDILINEILFNPRPGGTDFIEVYNPSDKYINLKGWHLSRLDNPKKKTITHNNIIMAPDTYRVFTADPTLLKDRYPQGVESLFITVDLPPFPDDKGIVTISRPNGATIDSLSYDQAFHSPFLRQDEGVSLERISLIEDTNAPDNWRSANSSSGFATPGFINSNFRPAKSMPDGVITVEPIIFTPYSGLADFIKITFRFKRPGLVATVKAVDHQGRLVKTIANNELIGAEGFFRWEGDMEGGTRARVGYYYISFVVFDSRGAVYRCQKRVVVFSPQ